MTTTEEAGRPAATERDAVVPTAVGDLNAIVRVPTGAGTPLPGLVLVDGSGDGDRHGWGHWPEWITEAGSVVLRHDKPGCGGSPGHWTDQSLHDRALESLAALAVLREQPEVRGAPVGLYGVSQGGWVAILAAALRPEAVDLVVCHSGPATSPAVQERSRIMTRLVADGHDDATVVEAMAWVDERLDMLRRAEPVEAVLARQSGHRERPWYAAVATAYDTAEELRFAAGLLDFDPAAVLPRVRCPVLGMLGGADPAVPVQASLRAYAEHLPPDPRHGFAVFPGADHGLFLAPPDQSVPRRDQLAPAYLSTLTGFLSGLLPR